MYAMRNPVRHYPWGSRTAIASMAGRPSPSAEPEAEMWIGAHPDDSSSVVLEHGERPLVDVIAADSAGALGAHADARFGSRLPFLLKVLAAAAPLSLQAHPSPGQAREGFAREDSAGIPRTAAHRNYRDTSDKPELICALTEFHALCGFRDPAATLRVLRELRVPALDRVTAELSGGSGASGIRRAFLAIMRMPRAEVTKVSEPLLAACAAQMQQGHEFHREYRTVLELADRYPGDPGVLVALLMNRVVLQPGQALFLPAGNLHAYLSGTGVEIMANSDNVLRGGLTGKHVDVPELNRVLDFRPMAVDVQNGTSTANGERRYPVPTDQFSLSALELSSGPVELWHHGPQVLLVAQGTMRARAGTGAAVTVPSGGSLWVPPGHGVAVSGHGQVFRATDGLLPPGRPDRTLDLEVQAS